MTRFHPALRAILFASGFSACGGEDHTDSHDHDHDHDVALQFRAEVGDQAFACGESYPGLGSTGTTWTATDLRFYVHDFRAVASDGSEEPLDLIADGAWQTEAVALLDFEDKSGPCSNGTAETNGTINLKVPHGTFTALRFKVGVPFDQNHQDVAVAPSPLNLSTLFWNWQGGYKFIRLEGKSTGLPNGVVLHLGSTGCQANADGDVTSCTSPNRPEIEVEADVYGADDVVFDVAALYQAVNLDTNAGGPPGCMAGTDDQDCAGVFKSLGLPFGADPGGAASAFRVE